MKTPEEILKDNGFTFTNNKLYYDENGALAGSTARTGENWDMPLGENARVEASVLPGTIPSATSSSSKLLVINTSYDSILDIMLSLSVGTTLNAI